MRHGIGHERSCSRVRARQRRAGRAGTDRRGIGAHWPAAPLDIIQPACTIRAFDGHYLTAVGGGGRTTDVIHSNATQIQAWEEFYISCP